MRKAAAAALLLLPSFATAETGGTTEPPTPPPTTTNVVGGHDAPLGKWPDAAAMLYDGQQECTGTLIAPTIAITAGHCNLSNLNSILVGTNALNRASDGETLPVARTMELTEADVTVVVLGQASRFTPRAIGTGWAQADIKNGARVEIVGYGATDANASQFTNTLQEVESTITDFNCSVMPGCSQNELGAGGNGIDSCNGDSGGPLYLLTDYGDFLVGVTSRAYSNAQNPCGEGGIYGRPDLIIDAIEKAAGVAVTRGPEPTAPRIEAIRNGGGETVIDANDPKSDSHTFAVTTPPAHGTAAVRADGTVRVCVATDAPTGDKADTVTVTVTDSKDPTRAVPVKIQVAVGINDPGKGCDVNAFESGDDGGGCCDSGGRGAGGSVGLSLFVLVVLRRRRR